MTKRESELTSNDRDRYNWIDVTTLADKERVFLRGSAKPGTMEIRIDRNGNIIVEGGWTFPPKK